MRKSTALMKQSSNAQPVCNMPRNECTEHHVPSQTLHQFAAATQSINSNRVMHFGAFHFLTGEQICYDEGFWFSTLSIGLINVALRWGQRDIQLSDVLRKPLTFLSCIHAVQLLRSAAVLGCSAFWHEVQDSSAAVLCHQILPRPLFMLEQKGGW